MEFDKVLFSRRSIREFNKDKIKDEEINCLLHAAMASPSAMNRRPLKYIVVTNEETLNKIKNQTNRPKSLSPLIIIVVGDMSKVLEGEGRDYWIEDAAASTENILLKARDLSLSSLWCGVYPIQERVSKLKKTLNLSENEVPFNIIMIGHSNLDIIEKDYFDEDKIKYIR